MSGANRQSRILSFRYPIASISRRFLRRNVFDVMSKVSMKPVSALELERLGAFAVGFNFVRHHHKAVVARLSPSTDFFSTGVRWSCPGNASALLRGLASVKRSVRVVFVRSPVDAAFASVETFPLDWKDMAKYSPIACRCFRSRSLVECHQRPVHLSLGEVCARSPVTQNLRR